MTAGRAYGVLQVVQSMMDGTCPVHVLDGVAYNREEAIATWNLEQSRSGHHGSTGNEPVGGFG